MARKLRNLSTKTPPLTPHDLHPDGSAKVLLNNKDFHIWNAIPGETVICPIDSYMRRRKELQADEIVNPSPFRLEPLENHFVSCSPWQIISLDHEHTLKKDTALKVFKDFEEVITLLNASEVYSNNIRTGYRHKMEYHIYTDEDERFHLGIFGRMEKKKIPIEPCVLATPSINKAATAIIDWLDQIRFPRSLLKTIILRSNRNGQVIAGLYTKTRDVEKLTSSLPFDFVSIFYSEPKSPASVVTDILHLAPVHTLTEKLRDTTYTYGITSFFQINPDVFEQTLVDIQKHIPTNSTVLDFYSGVGAIGLSLQNIKHVTLVEENAEAVSFAKQNIERNALHADTYACQAHEILQSINGEDILIVDPPRGGLHPRLCQKIRNALPPKVIYLSCNIESQARDLKELIDVYKPVYVKLYNYFPMTPHVECLIVLEKRVG